MNIMDKKQYVQLFAACVFMTSTTNAFAMESTATMNKDNEASKDAVEEYALDDVIITATRTEKKDTDVPAATITITSEQIQDSGAKNAADVLSKMDGFAYKSLGPANAAMGKMNNELNIRGIGSGTLVLLNGNPFSWRGKYNLDSIPAESIERIEIVKGGGSVLYGSDAMGGVVNIITKKAAGNQVSVGYGSYGQQSYNVNAGDEKFSVNYSLDKWKHFGGINGDTSKTYTYHTDIDDVKKENIGLTYQINDYFDAFYGYYNTESHYNKYIDAKTGGSMKIGAQYNERKFKTEQNIGQLNFHQGDWKGSIYINVNDLRGTGTDFFNNNAKYDTHEKTTSYGFDVQKGARIGNKVKTVFGMDLQHERYELVEDALDLGRNIWGIFGQWEQNFDRKNTGIFSARETWTNGTDKNYNNFSMAVQFLHKLGREDNLYLNVGQSFVMPTFAQVYGSGSYSLPAENLKPQTGKNYEFGWKKVTNMHAWKAALFHTDIKDNITATFNSKTGLYNYYNEDFKNTGIELSCDIAGKSPFSWHWGITWQNPQTKTAGKKEYWDSKLGKLQFTGGITYKAGKWTSAFSGSYLCMRRLSDSGAPNEDGKPYFLTSWNTSYSPNKTDRFTLTIDNVFNRHDNTSASNSLYFTAPTSYMLSFTHQF